MRRIVDPRQGKPHDHCIHRHRHDWRHALTSHGGEPFGEEILLWWNFVARHPEEMAEATNAWNTHTYFGDVKGSPSPRLIAPDISGLHLRGAGK
jgi:hypothetical protein